MNEVWIVSEYYFEEGHPIASFSTEERANNYITNKRNNYIKAEMLEYDYSKEEATDSVEEIYTWVIHKHTVE